MTVLDPIRQSLQRTMAATAADEQAHHDWTYETVKV